VKRYESANEIRSESHDWTDVFTYDLEIVILAYT